MAAPRVACSLSSRLVCRFLSCRHYSRRHTRRVQDEITPQEELKQFKSPNKIIDPRKNPFQSYIPSDPIQKSLTDLKTAQEKERRNKAAYKTKQKKKTDGKKSRDTNLQDVNHTQLDDSDKTFGNRMLNVSSKRRREDGKEFVLEGKHLIKDFVEAGAILKAVYFSGTALDQFPPSLLTDIPVYKVSYKQMKLWANVTTPQGIVGFLEMPKEGEITTARNTIELTLICDEIRDPGNMGTILRSAAAVGCQKVLATRGCVDVWDSKVLRAGGGAHFRVPILRNLSWSVVQGYISSDSQVFAAECRQPTDELIKEISGSKETAELLADLEDSDNADEDSDPVDEEEDEDYHNVPEAYETAPMRVSLYDSVDYVKGHCVLILGGETGLSLQARKLAYDKYGQFVTLPMAANLDSLNNAVAGSVLMYEVLRQFRRVKVKKE